MSKLVDLEICRRIAEIEGVPIYRENNCFYGDGYFRADTVSGLAPMMYNPLTDDALWVKLIEKYEVSISFVFCKVLINLNGVHERNFNDRLSLRRSAMLLIIRAHNER